MINGFLSSGQQKITTTNKERRNGFNRKEQPTRQLMQESATYVIVKSFYLELICKIVRRVKG